VGKNNTDPTGKRGREDDRDLLEDFASRGYLNVYDGSAFDRLDAKKTNKLLRLLRALTCNMKWREAILRVPIPAWPR